jgi:hypothetical protein
MPLGIPEDLMSPGPDPRYRQNEEQYYRLRGQLASGRITRQQFEAELQRLVLQDSMGRYWAVGADSGQWMMHDGRQWVRATPPGNAPPAPGTLPSALPEESHPVMAAPAPAPQTVPPQPVPPQPVSPRPAPTPAPSSGKGGCGKGCVIGCLFLLVLCVVGSVGVWFGFQSGAITLNNIFNLAGQGPGYIEVDNFRDDSVQVSILQTNAAKDATPSQGTLTLNAFDVKTFRSSGPGKYKIDFVGRNGLSFGTCTIDLRGGEQYQFVALPQRTVVNRASQPPATGRDLLIETSALCRGGAQ